MVFSLIIQLQIEQVLNKILFNSGQERQIERLESITSEGTRPIPSLFLAIATVPLITFLAILGLDCEQLQPILTSVVFKSAIFTMLHCIVEVGCRLIIDMEAITNQASQRRLR